MSSELLVEREAAELMGLARGTIRRWRHEGRGPAFLKLGKSKRAAIRYRRSDLEAWLEAQCVSHAAQLS